MAGASCRHLAGRLCMSAEDREERAHYSKFPDRSFSKEVVAEALKFLC
jgi:hypothetical protein